MTSNINLIMASVLTANIVVASIVPLPNSILNYLAIIVTVCWLLFGNTTTNNRLKGA